MVLQGYKNKNKKMNGIHLMMFLSQIIGCHDFEFKCNCAVAGSVIFTTRHKPVWMENGFLIMCVKVDVFERPAACPFFSRQN